MSTGKTPLVLYDRNQSKYINSIAKKQEGDLDAIMEYVYNGYLINESIRSCKGKIETIDDSPIRKTTKDLQRAFKSIVMDRDIYLFRGFPQAGKFVKNSCLRDNAFLSTTLSLDVATHFMRYDQTNDESCCVIHIHIPRRKKIKMIFVSSESHKHEREILFPLGTKLELITNTRLLEAIASQMNYEIVDSPSFEDMFSNGGQMIQLPYKAFKKDGLIIVPMQIDQSALSTSPILSSSKKSQNKSRQTKTPRSAP